MKEQSFKKVAIVNKGKNALLFNFSICQCLQKSFATEASESVCLWENVNQTENELNFELQYEDENGQSHQKLTVAQIISKIPTG